MIYWKYILYNNIPYDSNDCKRGIRRITENKITLFLHYIYSKVTRRQPLAQTVNPKLTDDLHKIVESIFSWNNRSTPKIQQINTHDSDLLQADSNTCVICLSQFGYKTSLNANAIIWIWYIIVICSVSVVDAI